MGSSAFSIAVSGLNAAQAGLLTTSHNIANASTAGFNRQTVVQTTQTPQFTGAGFFGQGTTVNNVVRAYSKFLSDQVTASQASASQLDIYAAQIKQIDNMLADPTVGLSPVITSFFQGVAQVASSPSSIPARQSLLSTAESMVARFHSLDQQLSDLNSGVNSQIDSEVTTINSIAVQIGDINQRIAVAESSGVNQQANDLRDQRDQLLLDLNKHVRADIAIQSDGSYSVFIGNGQPLVVGENSYSLVSGVATNDSSRVAISLKAPNGTVTQIPESFLSGGALGGLLQFRSETLDEARNSLGRIAAGLASTFNTQHRLGQDLTGALGGDFFAMPAPVVSADSSNPSPTVQPGTVQATITDPAALTTSDYLLTAASNGYTLIRLADNTTVFSGGSLPITVDGMSISVSGAPASGSSFKIMPTRYAARDIGVAVTDPRGIAAGTPVLAAASTANTGTARITSGALTAPLTLTYSSGLQGYSGFPAGSAVSIWNGSSTTTVNVSSPSQIVSIPSGANVSVDGITFQINGASANGDRFTVGPNQLQAATGNIGGAAIVAGGRLNAATFTYSSAANSFALTPLPNPLLGVTVNVTSGGVTTTYPIRQANETVPYVAGATYTYGGLSFTLGGAAPANGDTFTVSDAVTATAGGGNTGAGTISALPVASGATLANATLSYNASGNLIGFPAGTVTVTTGGSTLSYASAGPATQIPFIAGATYGFNGINVAFGAGTPAVGDTFAIAAPPTTTSATATLTQAKVNFSAALPTANYTLSYDSASNQLTGFPVGTTVSVTANGQTTQVPILAPNSSVSFTDGMVLMVNGVRVTLSGSPANGDTFTIGPNPASSTDNRNALLLGALQTAKTLLGGTSSYESSYAQMVSEVGNTARQVNVSQEAQATLLSEAQTNQQSFSGVNLDEEAANLLRYQQAYQASAKIIDVSSKLFDLLVGMGG